MPSEKLVLPIVWLLKDKAISGLSSGFSFQNFTGYIGGTEWRTKISMDLELVGCALLDKWFYYINGLVTPITPDDVTMMPIPNAQLLTKHLDVFVGEIGKIIKVGGMGRIRLFISSVLRFQLLERSVWDSNSLPAPTVISKMSCLPMIALHRWLYWSQQLQTSGMLQLPSWAVNAITVTVGYYNRQTGNSTFLGSGGSWDQIGGYRYYSASAGDVRPLTIRQLTFRITNFSKVHNQEIRNRIHLAGGKA